MRGLLFVALVGCATDADWNAVDEAEHARTVDTGLALVPTEDDACPQDDLKVEPGFCGCDWLDIEVDANPGADACIHQDATVSGSAALSVGVSVGPNAVVGAATLGTGATIAGRATIADGAVVGQDTIVSRGASVGLNSLVGPDSTVGRAATLGSDVDASVGGLNIGYASSLGDRVQVLGTGVVVGNLVDVGADTVLGAGVVFARGVTVGTDATIGANVVVGPEVQMGNGVNVQSGVRIRKNAVIGADSEIGEGARIGRDSMLFPGSLVGSDAVLRSDVTVEAGGQVFDDEYIPRGTVVVAVDNCGPASGFDKSWSGAVSDNWSDSGNWSPAGVPSSTQSAFICGTAPTQPRLTSSVSVEGLGMSQSAVINLGGHTLAMFGDMQASLIEGAGTVNVNRAVNIEGTVTNIDITNRVTLSGSLTVNNRMTINTAGTLLVTDETLTVAGPFTQTISQPNRGLKMSGDDAYVSIGSLADFYGSSDMGIGNLGGGELHLQSTLRAEDSGFGVFRAGGATVFLDSSAGQSLLVPDAGPTGNYVTDLVVTQPSGTPTLHNGDTFYVRGDLQMLADTRLNVQGSMLDVRGDVSLGSDVILFDTSGELRYGGVLSMDGTARLNVRELIAEGEVPRPAGVWEVSIIAIEGDVALDADWHYSQNSLRIRQPGSLTVNGHDLTLDGQLQQDIGTDSDGGLRMAAGDTVQINGGAVFSADVDMDPGNFAGGDFGVTGNINIENVDVVVVTMPGTRLLMNGGGPGNNSGSILYGGAGRSFFSDLVLGQYFTGATQLNVDVEQVVGDLTVLRAVTPNKDLRVTGTLTVAAGGFVGSASGAITTVEGACVIDPSATVHNNVQCP